MENKLLRTSSEARGRKRLATASSGSSENSGTWMSCWSLHAFWTSGRSKYRPYACTLICAELEGSSGRGGTSEEFVVSKNLVSAGMSGSLSTGPPNQHFTNVPEDKEDSQRRLRVSRIIISTSVLPTPGPPLRERDGSTRFCLVCIPGFAGAFGVADGGAGVTDSCLGTGEGFAEVPLAGRFPWAFAEGGGASLGFESVMVIMRARVSGVSLVSRAATARAECGRGPTQTAASTTECVSRRVGCKTQ